MRGRQIIGPRRVALVVLHDDADGMTIDDAIDIDAMGGLDGYRAYWESLFDPAKLVLRGEPSWFTIHPISMAQKLAAPQAPALSRAAFLVRASCTKIENYPILLPDGTEKPCPQPERRKGSLGEMATEEWLIESALSARDIRALGLMIEYLSEAQHPLALRSGVPSSPSAPASVTEKSP